MHDNGKISDCTLKTVILLLKNSYSMYLIKDVRGIQFSNRRSELTPIFSKKMCWEVSIKSILSYTINVISNVGNEVAKICHSLGSYIFLI